MSIDIYYFFYYFILCASLMYIVQALVDGPEAVTGVKRQAIHFKRLSLTDHVVKVPRNARQTLLAKAVTSSDVKTKFANSTWGKKLAAKKARANTTDFDRFKITVLKKRVSLCFFFCPRLDRVQEAWNDFFKKNIGRSKYEREASSVLKRMGSSSALWEATHPCGESSSSHWTF